LKAPLNPGAEPFSIKRGSTFTASGGTIVPPNAAGRLSAISNDIREAEEIIGKNHIGGRKLNAAEMTKTALDGMMRSLDPHSNFYDAAEWKDLLDEQQSSYSGMGA